MIPFNERTLNIDAGPKCTLQCSACTRTRFRANNEKIPGKDLTPEQFKKIIKYFKRVSFCGTFSDPIFNVHFIEILKICRDENIFTEVHSAASHKPEKWWQEAFLANINANWIFGIDGLPKDSHKYRVNQDGEFLFDMMLLNKYLGSKPEWQYIVFDYNKDDIEEAKKIAKQHKLKFMLILSNRPVAKEIKNEDIDIEDKDGTLGWKTPDKKEEKPDQNWYLDSKVFNNYTGIDFSNKNISNQPKRSHRKYLKEDNNKNTLKPKCLLTNRDLSYSVTGHILPCCWVNVAWEDESIKKLFKDKLHIDNNKSIEDILDSDEWKEFMSKLENSPDKDIPSVCKRYCSTDLKKNVEGDRKLYANNLL